MEIEYSKKNNKLVRAFTVTKSLTFVEGMLTELQKKYDVVLLSSPGEKLEHLTSEYGIKSIGIPMERHISPFKDFIALCKIIHALKKEKPTLVHSMTPKAGLLCMIAGKITKVPLRVHTFTGLVFPTSKGLKRKILMFTDRLTCACATHIIPEGEGVKNDLLKNKITKKPIKVLGNGNVMGVDMERFSKRPIIMDFSLKLRKKELFTFLFVGRIVHDKGIDELCESFHKIHSKFPNTRLTLVGDYEEELDPIKESSKKLIKNSDNGIQAVGIKRDDELIAYYAAADCFILPSYREGFPNTVLEAGAMGLPSIVTDINGSREIIIEGENGTIIPSKDEKALTEAMERMITQNQWRDNMANNARKMIEDRFEQSYVRKCLFDFYDEILTNSSLKKLS